MEVKVFIWRFFLRPKGEVSSGVSHYEGATHTVIENLQFPLSSKPPGWTKPN